MKPTPILLDVDAGVDDTLAILFAILSPHVNVCAITTVAGNVPVRSCTRNVLLTLDILSSLVPTLPVVSQGASKPLRQKLFTAKEVHGDDGIGGASLQYPKPKCKQDDRDATEVILAAVRRQRNLTIVATGPLTNIALALKKNHIAMKQVREIVVMGGAFDGRHNTGPVAEFNFYVDPDAADSVMHSGIPVRLIPLNVTEQCIMYPDDFDNITNTPLRQYLRRVTKFYFDFHKGTESFNGGYLHDPLAVAAAIQPSLVQTERGYVDVETEGKYTRGMSVFFPRLTIAKNAELPPWVKHELGRAPSVRVATKVNAPAFKRKFLKTLAKAH